MDQKNHEKTKREIKHGYVHLSLFFILIWAGIITKRVFGHPEYMMLFHGPAAVFLIVGGLKVTARQREKYLELIREKKNLIDSGEDI